MGRPHSAVVRSWEAERGVGTSVYAPCIIQVTRNPREQGRHGAVATTEAFNEDAAGAIDEYVRE